MSGIITFQRIQALEIELETRHSQITVQSLLQSIEENH